MRVWIFSAALAVAALGGLPTATFAASTPTPTSRPQGSPSPTVAPTLAKPPPSTSTTTPTRVPSTSTPTNAPTATAQPTMAPTAAPTVKPAAPATPVPAVQAVPSPAPSVVATVASGTGAIHGEAFVDANANGEFDSSEVAFTQVDIALSASNGTLRTTRTNEDGMFAFDGVVPGKYRVMVAVPVDYVATTDAGVDVDVEVDAQIDGVHFGLISMEAAGLKPTVTLDQGEMDDEQIIALAS